MAQIKIYGDVVKGCIFFDGSTIEPKFLGTILAELHGTESDRVIVYRTDRETSVGEYRQLFRRLQVSRVQNESGENLVTDLSYSTQQVVDYINEQSNLTSSVNPVVDTSLNGIEVGFSLDSTSTTILFDNGYQYGVNSIKAVDTGDGLITIKSIGDSRVLFTELDHTNVDINGSDAAGGLNDVINVLNELFTVGAFESVVISDPYATMIADTTGVVTTETNVTRGSAIETQPDEYGATVSGYNKGGYITPEVINQAGEYYTFDIRNEGIMGFGLVVSDDDFADGKFNGNSAYADPSSFCSPSVANSGNYGYQFSHWFHPSPNGPWTNYGANVAYSMREGWSNATHRFSTSPEGAKWLNGDVIRMKVGIDENNFIVISYYDESELLFIPIARTTYAVPNGNDFHLGIKFGDSTVRMVGLPRVHLLVNDYSEPAPTMYFRYIESPDGVFHYPLFSTQEEADYYDKVVNGGDGFSHTHTYADDATNTTWYMPEANHDASIYTFNSAPDGTDTFSGNVVNYTEITSLTDSDLTPIAFVGSDITQEEGTVVNLQVEPQGVSYSTSVSITPSGSGLVFNGTYLVQGTLTDVGSDTVYTVTVTRANSYGSSVGSMTITATDVAPVQTNDTAWTKALDFSGSNEHLKIVNTYGTVMAIRMKHMSITAAAPLTSGYTSNDYYALPWATSIVFKSDNNNSNQHIWNSGEGANSSNDNIFLRQSSDGKLWFGWGRGSTNNEVRVSDNLDSSKWYGVYIAHNGTKLSNPTTAQLVDAFDIRIMSTDDSFASVGSEVSNTTNWNYGTPNGYPLNYNVTGDFTIGGRGSNRNFHGKVASFVCTTLKSNVAMPTDAEIKLMISDPVKWLSDFKSGVSYRATAGLGGSTNGLFPSTFPTTDTSAYLSTQVYLMGDGGQDSYANGIRNYIKNTEQNNTKLQLNSMVSNDIETVNINGLT